MRIEEASALISPVLPLHRASDVAEADWMRAFALSRIGLLAVSFCGLPLALALSPQAAANGLGAFLACVVSATAGIVALMYASPAISLAAASAGLVVLVASPWIGASGPATAALAIMALACDVLALPGTMRAQRWLMATMAGIGALIACATAFSAGISSQSSAALLLLPLAPLATLSMCLIAARYRLETSLAMRTSAERRNEIVAAAADVAVAVVDRGGHVSDATPSMAVLMSCALADLDGRGLIDRILIADRPAFLKAVSDAAMHGRGSNLTLRLAAETADPATFRPVRFADFDLSIRPTADASDAATIRIAPAAPVHKERTFDRSGILHALSHEIRTPMNAILGFSEILGDARVAPDRREQVADYARIIHRSAKEAFAVTRALIDLMRVEDHDFSSAPEQVNVRETVMSVAGSITERASGPAESALIGGDADVADIAIDPRLCRMMVSAIMEGFAAHAGAGARMVCGIRQAGTDVALDISVHAGEAFAEAGEHAGGAHFAIVEELCARIATMTGADFQLDVSERSARASIVFRSAGSVTTLRPAAASADFNNVLPLRKSA